MLDIARGGEESMQICKTGKSGMPMPARSLLRKGRDRQERPESKWGFAIGIDACQKAFVENIIKTADNSNRAK
jgi:hypothetical protein